MELKEEAKVVLRIHELYDRFGIDKTAWMEMTGFSEHQWYRWTNPNNRSHPSTPQAMQIFRGTDISPTFAWFELGPERLSHFNTDEPSNTRAFTIEEKIDLIYRFIVERDKDY